MVITNTCIRALAAAAAIAAFSSAALPVLAEEYAMEEVIVVVPNGSTAYERRIGSHKAGSEAQLGATVNFADLDLRLTADVQELERRVGDAASMVCEALADAMPQGQPTRSDCERQAREDALAKIDRLVELAMQ